MALKEAGIHNVHYTTDDGFVYRYQEIFLENFIIKLEAK